MLKPKIAPTSLNVSDKVQDLSIIHAINLERLKQGEVVKVLDILDDLGLSIQKQLEKIDPTGVGPTYRARRLARLLKNVKATTKAHFSKAKAANSKGLSGVASISAKATQNIINGSLGVSLGAALPSAANLQSLAGKVLIEGDVVSEYWKQQNAQVTGNFLRQMRMGVAGGEGLQSLIQRVRGTKENNFTDGIMNATKKKAETLVRSSVAAVNNEAIINTYQANEDLFNGYQWMATLDSRTSDICKARSGLTWDKDFQPVGHGIGWSAPPAHFNCRSTVIGVLKPWADLANKPLPAVGAETLKEELTKSLMARGLSPALISKAINKTQQSMDGFVAGDINFEDWLKGKSERFQKAILGEQKWELWNTGKIGFVDLVDQKSHPRSLAELQALVDQGRTSPLKANKAAKEAAKQQAEAAALAAKAAEKAENAAQAQIDEIASGSAGANKKKVYDKLKKDGIDGLSATQVMAKIDEGVAQINITANIAKAKKKLKDGKPLSKTEDAAWATVDDDLKAAFIASLEADSAILKAIDKQIEKVIAAQQVAEKLGLNDFSPFLKAKKAFSKAKLKGQDYVVKEFDKIIGKNDFDFLKSLQGFMGIDSLKKAKNTLSKADAEEFLNKYDEVLDLSKSVDEKFDEISKAAEAAGKSFDSQSNRIYATLLDDAEEFDIGDYGSAKGIISDYFEHGPDVSAQEASITLKFISDQVAVNNKIVTDQIKKQTDEATEYLSKAKEGGTGFSTHKVAYDNLSKSGGLTGDAIVDAAKVQAQKDVIQAAKSLAAMKTKIKKKFKANKPLASKEQEAFDSLSADDQDLLKEAASAGKTAKQLDDDAAAIVTQKATQRADEGVLFDDLEQVGKQDGSNLGGLFRSKVDGQEFYIKAPDTELMAKVEVLSAKLYQAAGVKVADVNLLPIKGSIGGRDVDKIGISSRIEKIDDVTTAGMKKLNGTQEGFAADAWLANWDVIGNGGPKQLNLKKMADGSSFRIDTGGTLFFRAQGGRKAFSKDEVLELESLRFNDFNSGKVFGKINEDQIVAGVARIVAISDDDIRRLVNDIMGDDADDLAEVLIGRKNVLKKTYADQLKKYQTDAPDAPTAPVTKQEAKLVEESGTGGYSIVTDKDEIEDQLVHFYNFEEVSGKARSGAYLKIRGARAKKLDEEIQSATGSSGETVRLDIVEDSILTAVKGIGVRNKAQEAYQQKDINRSEIAIKQIDLIIDELDAKASTLDADDVKALKAYYLGWKDDLQKFVDIAKKQSDKHFFVAWNSGVFSPQVSPKAILKAGEADEIVWVKKTRAAWNRRSFKDGKGRDNGEGQYSREITNYETNVDGVKVRYFPSNSQAAFRNRIEMEVDGDGIVAIETQLKVMARLGINTKRASQADREELYLMQSLYAQAAEDGRKGTWYNSRVKKAAKLNQEERIKYLQKEVSDAAGVDDITALSSYNPFGDWQQYGYGRVVRYRPDLVGPEWEDFQQKYVISHSLHTGATFDAIKNIIDGGGQMAPTMDKLRRGVPIGGMSPTADMETGGAQYFFTRIKRKRSDIMDYNGNIIWKGKVAGRMDALSYDSDNYGKTTTESYVLKERYTSVKGMEYASRGSSNETIFKDSLSLFDDLEVLIMKNAQEAGDLMNYLMLEKGMDRWPDGRKLSEVIKHR